MPLLVPPISTPATPPLITPAASGAAAVAPENSFGSVLAQAAGADQPASAAAAPTTGIDTTGAGTSVDETADATRVAAEAAAGLFVVAPGVVLSQAGSAVAGDSIGGPTGGPAGVADPNAPPSDATRPTDAVSRAAEFRLREFVAPQALPQTATARPTNLPARPAEPAAAELPDTTTPPVGTTPVPGTAANQLPLPTTAGSLPSAGTGLPAGRSPSVVAQVPIVNDLVPPAPTPPAALEPAATPVAASVAPAPLPGVTVGERPAVAGERQAADAIEGARLAATAPAGPSATPFARVLAGTTPPEVVPGANAPRPPVQAVPAVSGTRASQTDTRVPPNPVVPAAGVNPLTPPAPAPAATSPVAAAPTAPAVVAPRSNVSPPVTAAAVAPPTDTTAGNTARPTATEPVAAPITPAGPKPVAVPTVAATPLPTTFDDLLRDRPAVEPEPARPVPTDSAPTAAVALAAPAPTAPQASPVAPMPATAPARPPAAVQVADGVVAHARTLDRDGTVEFRLRLDPPELGRVYVRLLADGDAVRGHVVVADEAVRQVIESQLPELRQRLEAAGLSVGRFDVSADPGADGRGNPYRDAAAEGGYESAAATARTVSRSTGPARSGRLDVTV